jgi:hypothetical protein
MQLQNIKILDQDGPFSDPDTRESRREKLRQDFQFIASVPEAKGWIEPIDFTILNRLFKRLAERCGLDPNNLNLLGSSDLVIAKGEDSCGFFNQDANVIGLNLKFVENLELSEKAKRLFVLHLLMHELIHAIGHLEVQDTLNKDGEYEEVRVGLKIPGDTEKPLFLGLDEGMTELMAYRLVNEYLEESGWMKVSEADELRKQLPLTITQSVIDWTTHILKTVFGQTNVLHKNQFPVTYTEEKEIIGKLLKVLSKETGVSEEEIFNAFIREKMTGELDLRKEWKKLFIELMGWQKGTDFFGTLATLNPHIGESIKRTQELLDETLKESNP